MVNKQEVLDALLTVIDHKSNKNIVELGLVTSVLVNDGVVYCILNLSDAYQIEQKNIIEKKCRDVISTIPNLKEVKIVFTAAHDTVNKHNKSISTNKISIPGVKNIILISSGKGGVGKSTMAMNIALSLLRKGYKSALADLDIYGPSIPHMLGVKDVTNPEVDHSNKMIPITKYGIKSMSIGYLINKDNAAIWRGPMVTKAIYSLMMNTVWGEIDYLIIDTPPGTGDVHLSLVERFKITGVVVVSTPQDLAIIDAVKICDMMKKMNVHIIGIVENMSYFINFDSGCRTYIFGKQGVHKMANRLNISFLGEVALYPQICNVAELGNPLVLDHEICKIYDNITDNILCCLKKYIK
ncbi:cobQ/CobB/MinD/ParA nucleotide binding domain protein [Ehrlichia chaffeensis str. Liberty]|uniref:Mrp/NBP35 family ATP-binding protein n=1 Tax=Ehrlichia chaffeensis TaxID=945 RepID=UPI000444CD87|nr:Mrp/NBP35 family ATP-binding protein [Ehrlichia chaffeensis]AHX05234.1 cobQ/CobB/MinD/ParA nucleotide binding domain protein [Ehrlichia chaffeensis str. Jax]AHX06220.1 cobQ/CobB/MinD/ParA nucleotide binding domain protein [Ehrlichia chaffeensis str. Liberty]